MTGKEWDDFGRWMNCIKEMDRIGPLVALVAGGWELRFSRRSADQVYRAGGAHPDGSVATFCGVPLVVDESVPPGMVEARLR